MSWVIAIWTWLTKTRLGRFVGATLLVALIAGAAVFWINREINGVWKRGLAEGERRERVAWEDEEFELRKQIQAAEDDKQAAYNAIATKDQTRRRTALEQAQTISALQMSLEQERQANAGSTCTKAPGGASSSGAGRISRGVWNDIRAADHN